ncbi:hypothetical protein HOB91_01410 [Candidatus Woesearchaeota archaeon]|jgi:uncharacterized protein (UPF0333 family)|nr:hypothetical protein [Candidatus Woesearchaeota archaeon]MBT6402673.1 hypothetical protein [Candidatus Woesearchaeota archaeon]
MRKGQSEVIGLMVIVLILIFMGVLYLGFANLAGNDTLASQRVGIETENALNAVLRVNLENYDDKTIQDLIVECGGGFDCNQLENALKEVYTAVLKPGTTFSYWVLMEDEEIYATSTCQIGIVSSYVFVRDGIFYEAKLRLCKT